MNENKNALDYYLGEFLTSSYIESDNQFVDKLVLIFNERSITITPIPDTDELNIQFVNNTNQVNSDSSKTIFNEFIGKKLSFTWKAVNSNGYFDLLVFAFDNLQPDISILSEGSSLKFFKMTMI